MIGQTISHYKVLEKLGEGGMGVVYKALDTKLNREVALKFLPERVNNDEIAKARFLQEAQAAAGLNHSNICTVHGVEEHEGSLFMVMEYVDGGTLRDKVPFAKVDDAVSVALQIGEALHEAHTKGIVHRDIKADNIMLTSKGQAKVMDFGLAKLKGTLKLTRTSSTVGTLGYMAPEQIQGGEVDLRSDIFSFGVLLFEMLTGKLPFRGEHEAAMVYSIVNEDPQSIDQLRQDITPLLSNLIAKCLEKDPADRFQHMDEVVSELRRTQKKTSRIMRSAALPVSQQATQQTPSGTISQVNIPAGSPFEGAKRIPWLRIAVVIGIVAVFSVAGYFLFSPNSISINASMSTRILQIPFTQYSYPSLSPDGKWIAFPAADANGKWDIYYMHVNGGEPRKVTSDGTTFIQQTASISPDGSQIVYDKPSANNSTHDIFIISSLGGTSRKLTERGILPLWRSDGERVGFLRTLDPTSRSESPFMEFWSVNKDGSDIRREFADSLFVTKGGNYRFSFCWSPNGKSIAWIRSQSANSQLIVIRDLSSGKELQITPGNENIDAMVWTKDDRIIFSSNRGGNTNLWAIHASGGEAVQVTKGGGPDIGISIAASGNELVYLQQQRVGFLWMANIDGTSLRQISFDERDLSDPALSPDKKQIAFIMDDPDPLTPKSDVYVVDRDGNNRRRLTTGNPPTRLPAWSPDGKKLVYTVPATGEGADTGRPKLFVIDVENPGVPKFAGYRFGRIWWDNDHIISVGDANSYMNSLSSGQTRRFFLDSVTVWGVFNGERLVYYSHQFGKQGWWVVDVQNESGENLMKQSSGNVMPKMKSAPRHVSTAPHYLRLWASRVSRNGSMIQFTGDDKVRLISFSGRKEELLPGKFIGISNRSYDLSSDGQELVYVSPRLSSRLVLLENVFR
ncbi:MAG: protein kinase [Bacteroidota bacterium]